MKTCTRCRAEKPRSEFYRLLAGKDGLNSWCKECFSVQRKQKRRDESREDRLARIAQYRSDSSAKKLRAESGKKLCTKCNSEKSLDDFYRTSRSKDGRQAHCKECSKSYGKRYYEKNAEQLKASTRKYYSENRDSRLAYSKEYQQANADSLREYRERYYRDNRDTIVKRACDWQRDNHQRMLANGSRRRARERAATIVAFTVDQLVQRWAYYGNRCYLCGDEATQTDHVKPLAKGGAHALCNMRPICQPCNSSKRDKWPYVPVFERSVSCVTTSRAAGR